MKVINFIDGDNLDFETAGWRELLGYNWQELHWIEGTYSRDKEKCIAGDDRQWSGDFDATLKSVLTELAADHGENLIIARKSAFGFFDEVDNKKIETKHLEKIALVSGIGSYQCSFQLLIYKGELKYHVQPKYEEERKLKTTPGYANKSRAEPKKAGRAYAQPHNEDGEGFNPYSDNLWLVVE